MMTKEEKRYYYLLLSICLIASFSQNPILWMLINPLFSLISIFFYYRIRKFDWVSKDTFFIACLCCAAIQEIFIAQRYDKLSILLGVLFLFLMFFFFILTIQQEKEYLLLGRKRTITKSILIIVSAIVCYICFFLPIIPDFLVFPIFIHVFSLFFSFLIAVNRTINRKSYNYVISGIAMFVMTTIIAGVSLFIQNFPLSYFFERLSFMLGISFITRGLLKSYSHEKKRNVLIMMLLSSLSYMLLNI